MKELENFSIGQIWVADINPDGKGFVGKHPIVIIDVNTETDEVLFGSDLTLLGGTSKHKPRFKQIAVEPTATNGLSTKTFFNLESGFMMHSFEFTEESFFIGMLEEDKFNEIMDILNAEDSPNELSETTEQILGI